MGTNINFNNVLGISKGCSILITSTTTALLLDTYPNAAVAYSLRKLRTAYSGNCIRVRRSSDNTEQDFGFVNNVLDTASLLTFCGAGNGFVTTWYDQSGNANNSTQATATDQAQIVASGVTVKDPITNKISTLWTGDAYTIGSSIAMTQLNYKLSVFNRNVANARIYGLGTTSTVPALGRWGADNTIASGYGTGSVTHAVNTTTGAFIMTILRNSSSIVKCWMNNVAQTSGTSTGTASPITVFGQLSTIRSVGYKSEEIYWASDQEGNRTGIETNANNYWGVY